jgi:1-acyl-sn-glycerol-3-phosphate acyltransferase
VNARDAWLRGWGLARRYHRFEVHGIERLDTRRAHLVVGYHGRPIAYDLCMLSVTLHERLGYLPHGIVHQAFDAPLLRDVVDALGFVTRDGPALATAVARGEHVVVLPGGTREGCRSFRRRYRVDWGERLGYLDLAVRHGLPIIPVASTGVDDGYIGMWDGHALGKCLGVPARLPLWLGFGPLGPWPFSPPFPVRIRTHVGAPIDVPALAPRRTGERAEWLAVHTRVMTAVQSLLDVARGRGPA